MATRRELTGAFGSLSDTLMHRFDPAASEAVREAWLGIVIQHAAITRRFGDWLALAPVCTAYAPVVEKLNAATVALVTADEDAERHAALALADEAIADTSMLLDTNPCATRNA